MEENRESIADAIKRTKSISEAADVLNISRPTLYKYMDLYDTGSLDRIPPDVRRYFDAISGVRSTQDEIQARFTEIDSNQTLQEMRMRNMEARLADLIAVGDRRTGDGESLRWTDGELQTMCVPSDRSAAVFVRGVLGSESPAVVTVCLDADGVSVPVAEFRTSPSKAFVVIDDLPPSASYSYTVKHVSRTGVLSAGPFKLIMR